MACNMEFNEIMIWDIDFLLNRHGNYFFYSSSSAFTSLVFHLDPAGPLGYFLCRGPPNVHFSLLRVVGFEPTSL